MTEMVAAENVQVLKARHVIPITSTGNQIIMVKQNKLHRRLNYRGFCSCCLLT